MFTILPIISLALLFFGGVIFIYGLVEAIKRKKFTNFFLGLAVALLGWIGLSIVHSASAAV